MAPLHVEHAIDTRDVNNRVSEEDDVHLLDLLLLVILNELFVQEVSEVREVLNLFVHLHFLVLHQEVDEDGISLLIGHAVLGVVHLPLDFALVINHLFELLAIREANQSIVEDSQALVRPELDELVLALVVVFVGEEESLEDLGDVAHVVDVMSLFRRGQEILHALVEDVDRGQAQSVVQELDIIAELDELRDEDRVVDLSHLLFVRVREIDQVEFRDEPRGQVSAATSWFTHGCEHLKLAHEILNDL